jgi:hypothetical protein
MTLAEFDQFDEVDSDAVREVYVERDALQARVDALETELRILKEHHEHMHDKREKNT